jgi:asparagine synthase (glutamine-hydrolysing)
MVIPMCGIVGILTSTSTTPDQLRYTVDRMRETLTHRGPDDAGTWTNTNTSMAVGLGFRRLSIIDLSAKGHQPMTSQSGRFTMVFNGELYNFRSLKLELEREGAAFRGHSDSEVMLAAFEQWDVEPALKRFVGMFAIGVWDERRRRMYLVRDRLGEKPLFIHSRPGTITFGSELKSLRAEPGFVQQVNVGALAAYLHCLYVPAPHCINQWVIKLPPAHVIAIDDPRLPLPASRPYWSLNEVAHRGCAEPFAGGDAAAVDELEGLIKDAVTLQSQADVPLGALLSGGIDSSVVVAMMAAHARSRVRTFTIGFDVAAHDESRHAADVARHLSTDHTSLMVTGDDALAVIPRLAAIYDEPLADPSQIPTLLVSELARRSVTVALTGDGGDELFGGYNRYLYGTRIIPMASRVPALLRRGLGHVLESVAPDVWDVLLQPFGVRLPGEKVAKISGMLSQSTALAMYRSLVSVDDEPTRLLNGRFKDGEAILPSFAEPSSGTLLERMMLSDQHSYLPDDLLAKVDRASMAVSLETRVPLLDHRLVEFSWRLPANMKLRKGKGKWALRQVLYRHVPREMVDRPKVGFTVPIAAWLRGPLRSWAEDLLSAETLRRGGLLSPETVAQRWAKFLAGNDSLGLNIWTLLMFQAWTAGTSS